MAEREGLGSLDVPESIYGFAQAAEATMAWMYRTAAQLADNPKSRVGLEHLATAEDSHARKLAEVYPAIASAIDADDGPSEWTISRLRKEMIPNLDVNSLGSLLITAYRIEQGGCEFYGRWAEVSARPEARRVAEHLRTQESQHRKAIAARYRDEFGTDIEGEPEAHESIPWPRW